MVDSSPRVPTPGRTGAGAERERSAGRATHQSKLKPVPTHPYNNGSSFPAIAAAHCSL